MVALMLTPDWDLQAFTEGIDSPNFGALFARPLLSPRRHEMSVRLAVGAGRVRLPEPTSHRITSPFGYRYRRRTSGRVLVPPRTAA